MANTLNVNLNLNTSDFQRSLVRMQQNLSEFSRNMQRVGQDLTQNLSIPLLGVGAAAVKSFTDLDKLERGMTAVMGTSEAAAAELEKLKVAARAPGLGFEEAVRGSIRLQAVGLSADEARGTLQAFGAAIAATSGTAENLESVQYQLTQMISKNRILQEDFSILQENVPLIGEAMEAAFGTRNIELVRETGISAQEFNRRIVEALQTLPKVQNATGGLANAFDNFTDELRTNLADLGRIIAETINLEGILNGLSDALAAVVGWFKQLSPGAQKFVVVVAGIVAAIGPALFVVAKLSGLFATLSSGFRILISLGPKLGAAFTIATGPVGLAVLAIIGAIAAVGALYVKFEGVRRVVNGVGQSFVEFAKLAKNSFAALLEGFARLKEGDFKGAATQFGKALQVLNPVEQGKALAIGFAKGFEDTTDYLTPTIEKIKEQVKSAQNALGLGGTPTPSGGGGGGGGGAVREKAILPTKVQPLQELEAGATVLQKYGGEIERLAQANSGLGKTFDELGVKLNTVSEGGLTSFGEKMKRIREALDNFNEGAKQIIEGALEGLAIGFGEFLGKIADAPLTLRGLIGTILIPIADALINLGKLAVTTGIAVEGIKKALQTLNPIAAIVGGVALIALGSFVKSKAANLTKLAKGGLAFGPTTAIVGDNPAARTDPEVIAPLSKLKDYLNPGGGAMIAEARISGNDLLILVNNAERANNRIR